MHPPSIRLGWFFTENYSTRSKSYEFRLLDSPATRLPIELVHEVSGLPTFLSADGVHLMVAYSGSKRVNTGSVPRCHVGLLGRTDMYAFRARY